MSDAQFLASQLKFLDIGPDTARDIRIAGEIIAPAIDSMLDRFYEHILAHTEIKILFPDDEHVSRARTGQKNHWLDSLFPANFDYRFCKHTRQIGYAHARAGVTPSVYIGGYSYMLNQFNDLIACKHPADSTLVTRLQKSLTKAIFLDMNLVICCYLEIKDNAIRNILRRAIDFRSEVAALDHDLEAITMQLKNTVKAVVANQNTETAKNDEMAALIGPLADHATRLHIRLKELQFSDRLYIADDMAEADLLAHIRVMLRPKGSDSVD